MQRRRADIATFFKILGAFAASVSALVDRERYRQTMVLRISCTQNNSNIHFRFPRKRSTLSDKYNIDKQRIHRESLAHVLDEIRCLLAI